VLWATGQSDGDVYILRIDALSAAIDPVTLRYRVTSGAAVDLSPVTDALTDIQGAGFNTATDSLKILSDGADTQSTAISTLSTDVGTVQTDLTAVQGDVTAISTDVGTLSTDVGTLTTEVGTISTDVGTLTTDVGTLTTDVGAISTDLGEIQILITRILGLSQENIRITDHAYDGSGNLIGATIRTYPTAVDVANETNAIASYVLEAVYDVSNRLDDYSIRRA
jgi:outer membrane murein-binding lipoprotein Lpp